ncbi:MAG: hypothetical protein LBR50_08140 [Tannerella sp.]|nr:hypothetical protein [Tannerella sp.]
MTVKKYSLPNNDEPIMAAEPAVAYRTIAEASDSTNSWDPNTPFHGTQEEWWDHFHTIENGHFTPLEEYLRNHEAWKKEYLASRLT